VAEGETERQAARRGWSAPARQWQTRGMSALAEGSAAPPLDLPLLQGGRFQLAEATGAVILAFFKVDCPVCQFSFPYLQRLFSQVPERGPKLVGVAQNDARAAQQFAQTYGVRFPIALDAAPEHAASRAYGLSHVPTVFWVGADGRIAQTIVGFDKADYAQLAAAAGVEELFTAEEQRKLPGRRPG
jgi:peroxiredoxin